MHNMRLLCLCFVDIITASVVASLKSCHVIPSVSCTLGTEALASSPHSISGNWRSDVRQRIDSHRQQILYDHIDVSIMIEQENACRAEEFCCDTDCSSLQLYRTVDKAIMQSTRVLAVSLLSNAIPVGD